MFLIVLSYNTTNIILYKNINNFALAKSQFLIYQCYKNGVTYQPVSMLCFMLNNRFTICA